MYKLNDIHSMLLEPLLFLLFSTFTYFWNVGNQTVGNATLKELFLKKEKKTFKNFY